MVLVIDEVSLQAQGSESLSSEKVTLLLANLLFEKSLLEFHHLFRDVLSVVFRHFIRHEGQLGGGQHGEHMAIRQELAVCRLS